MRRTQANRRATLNVCFSYTSRNEIAAAMGQLVCACTQAIVYLSSSLVSARPSAVPALCRKPHMFVLHIMQGKLHAGDVSEDLLERCLLTSSPGSHPVDFLIRTSGEKRLSDFLLWQSTRCLVIFTRVLWPDLSLLHFLGLILSYQLAQPSSRSLHWGGRQPISTVFRHGAIFCLTAVIALIVGGAADLKLGWFRPPLP